MTLNVNNAIDKNRSKSGTTLFSRSLIPLNKVVDKQNKFRNSNVDQMFKLASNLRSRNALTTLKLVNIYWFTTQKKSQELVKLRMFSVTCNTMQCISRFPPQHVTLCLTNVNISVWLGPAVIGFPIQW